METDWLGGNTGVINGFDRLQMTVGLLENCKY